MPKPVLAKMSPFFIVSSVDQTIAFYRDRLGFECWHQEPEHHPFFAIVGRDGAMLFVKSGEVGPLPNSKRHPDMRWDAYVLTHDPDALAAQFSARSHSARRWETPTTDSPASKSPTPMDTSCSLANHCSGTDKPFVTAVVIAIAD